MGITPAKVAVIGGGISGLSTAYRLKKNGSDVVLFEAAGCVGGKIGTMYCEGFELDLGPVTCSLTPALQQLLSELELENDIIQPSPAVSLRYIYSNGKLHRIGSKVITSSLLSLGGKLTMLKAPFVGKGNSDESVAAYARRRFGNEAYQKLFNPIMNGIYAGNAELLSARSTMKRSGPRNIISLKGGMKSLINALANRLGGSIVKETTVTSLNDFDKVYIAAQAFSAASLIRTLDGNLAKALEGIRYSDVSQIFCEVMPGEQKFDGFGFLVPSEEKMSLLGAICVSNIFPDKAPDGKTLFVLFCGGDRPYSFTPTAEGAVHEFNKILQPAFTKILHVKEWKNAIPQFYVGHDKIVQSITQFEKQNPEVCLVGSYKTGVAVGDCV